MTTADRTAPFARGSRSGICPARPPGGGYGLATQPPKAQHRTAITETLRRSTTCTPAKPYNGVGVVHAASTWRRATASMETAASSACSAQSWPRWPRPLPGWSSASSTATTPEASFCEGPTDPPCPSLTQAFLRCAPCGQPAAGSCPSGSGRRRRFDLAVVPVRKAGLVGHRPANGAADCSQMTTGRSCGVLREPAGCIWQATLMAQRGDQVAGPLAPGQPLETWVRVTRAASRAGTPVSPVAILQRPPQHGTQADGTGFMSQSNSGSGARGTSLRQALRTSLSLSAARWPSGPKWPTWSKCMATGCPSPPPTTGSHSIWTENTRYSLH